MQQASSTAEALDHDPMECASVGALLQSPKVVQKAKQKAVQQHVDAMYARAVRDVGKEYNDTLISVALRRACWWYSSMRMADAQVDAMRLSITCCTRAKAQERVNSGKARDSLERHIPNYVRGDEYRRLRKWLALKACDLLDELIDGAVDDAAESAFDGRGNAGEGWKWLGVVRASGSISSSSSSSSSSSRSSSSSSTQQQHASGAGAKGRAQPLMTIL